MTEIRTHVCMDFMVGRTIKLRWVRRYRDKWRDDEKSDSIGLRMFERRRNTDRRRVDRCEGIWERDHVQGLLSIRRIYTKEIKQRRL